LIETAAVPTDPVSCARRLALPSLELQVTAMPEQHGRLSAHGEAVPAKDAAPEQGLQHMSFRQIADAAPAMIWQTDPYGSSIYRSRGWQDFTGQACDAALSFGWLEIVHEDDRARLHQSLIEAMLVRQPFRCQYRLRRADGAWRHMVDDGNPQFGDDGLLLGFVGVACDHTERKEAEEASKFIGRELSHRIKNIFAMISGLVGLSSRQHEGAQSFALALRERLAALARAHQFALPHDHDAAGIEHPSHTMQVLLQVLFEPYGINAEGARIAVEAEDAAVGSGAAITLAMLLHELTTNALKYGALSDDDGLVMLSGKREADDYVLVWEESGGPQIDTPPAKKGFGTTMVERAASLQLKARFDYRWDRDGLRLTLRIPLATLGS
jgi:PAS domain S-box-containing protein